MNAAAAAAAGKGNNTSTEAKPKAKSKAPKAKPKAQAKDAHLGDFADAFTITVKDAVERLRELVADARNISIDTVTDKMVGENVNALHKSGQLDETFRGLGIVPKPGWVSAVSGWHNVEHLRAAGATNKVAGALGIAYQAAAWGLAIYLGVDWYMGRA